MTHPSRSSVRVPGDEDPAIWAGGGGGGAGRVGVRGVAEGAAAVADGGGSCLF